MEEKKKVAIGEEGVYDARTLGTGKMLVLGFQHVFAMFGATVLVPLLTGLSVSTTLLMAGLGTLLFHFITKGKAPVKTSFSCEGCPNAATCQIETCSKKGDKN